MDLFNKKGALTYTQVGILFVITLVILIIFPLADTLAENITNGANDKTCSASLASYSLVSDSSLGQLEPTIQCPAQHYDIKETAEEKYFYEIYKLLGRCWEKSLGQMNDLAKNYKEDADVLFVCYSFSLDKDTELLGEDFANYMSRPDPKTKLIRADSMNTDWTSSDRSHFLVHVPAGKEDDDNVEFEKMEKLVSGKKYLVAFSVYGDHGLSNAIDIKAPKEWRVSNYHDITSDKGRYIGGILGDKDWANNNDYLKTVFILDKNEYYNVDLKNGLYWYEKVKS